VALSDNNDVLDVSSGAIVKSLCVQRVGNGRERDSMHVCMYE
jgi:hypothetical protein